MVGGAREVGTVDVHNPHRSPNTAPDSHNRLGAKWLNQVGNRGRGHALSPKFGALRSRTGQTPSCEALTWMRTRNEVLTLFGPNGAGKTTLLRILATLTRPDAGTVRIHGRDVSRSGEIARQMTGAALHSPMLYGHLTARENLLFHARMFRVPDRDDRVAEVAGIMQIQDRLDNLARELSNGLQRRVSLARAPCTGRDCCCSTNRNRASTKPPFNCWTASSVTTGRTAAP